ncbi:MAG: alpha/beta hydrolase [Oscillatoriaceae bacterium SKW80]|nr:alpha/beta hydrolase [Oscillatoriaceae bacterium SKYG93]MCX8119664.1 alpha/beta hydrolase [Oscillatoriaceae bacterium SKW80]MDW8455131.1 alpha/beta hydrolase [Oscillatoriaceae cyanobacterium SKYGB_i_bin93]
MAKQSVAIRIFAAQAEKATAIVDNKYDFSPTTALTVETNTPAAPTGISTGIGGTVREYLWTWKNRSVKIIYEVLGEGTPILFLPAFSTVSSRTEMRQLAEIFAREFQVIAVDWPGFGSSARPPLQYQPALYQTFLADFVRDTFTDPVVVIAAGHAASYVMRLAQQDPPVWLWVVLVAPTWRGPLPTMIGEYRWAYKILRKIVATPILGQFLYALNTLPPFLSFMYRRYVYGNPDAVTPSLIREKWRITQKRGARFATAAFVTGELDAVQSRPQFIELFQPLPVPTLIVIGEQTPAKSRLEMEVLVSFTGVQKCWLPGSLGLHEEHPWELANAILPFLRKFLSR